MKTGLRMLLYAAYSLGPLKRKRVPIFGWML